MNDTIGDSEIVGVFIEEAGEVFENIDNHFPIWSRHPNDTQSLTEIRRSFHTLKGSGRMVNALDLSEVAWKVENMLNRVIDGTLKITEPMVDLVSKARHLMPSLLDAFEQNRSLDDQEEVEALMAEADALAAGQVPARAPGQPAVAAGTGELQGVAGRIAGLERGIKRFQERADEGLRRSEMALRQARGVTAQFQVVRREAQDRVSRAEINPIIERVNLLGKEIMDLQRKVRSPSEQAPLPNQVFDQRVRERVTLIERQRSELERQLIEVRNLVASTRKLASWALTLSILVGGAVIATLLTL